MWGRSWQLLRWYECQAGEAVICQDAPDAVAEEACKSLGMALASEA